MTETFARIDGLKPDQASTTRPNLRAVIDAVILTPAPEEARGMHIDLEGRLHNVMAPAAGNR